MAAHSLLCCNSDTDVLFSIICVYYKYQRFAIDFEATMKVTFYSEMFYVNLHIYFPIKCSRIFAKEDFFFKFHIKIEA